MLTSSSSSDANASSVERVDSMASTSANSELARRGRDADDVVDEGVGDDVMSSSVSFRSISKFTSRSCDVDVDVDVVVDVDVDVAVGSDVTCNAVRPPRSDGLLDAGLCGVVMMGVGIAVAVAVPVT